MDKIKKIISYLFSKEFLIKIILIEVIFLLLMLISIIGRHNAIPIDIDLDNDWDAFEIEINK